jgi:hypothetical protein
MKRLYVEIMVGVRCGTIVECAQSVWASSASVAARAIPGPEARNGLTGTAPLPGSTAAGAGGAKTVSTLKRCDGRTTWLTTLLRSAEPPGALPFAVALEGRGGASSGDR